MGYEVDHNTDPTDENDHSPYYGPGVPNDTYTTLYSQLARLDGEVGCPNGQGFVTMHQGYLMMVNSSNGGGGSGSFAFLDISDPTNPEVVFDTKAEPIFSEFGSPHYAGNIRESKERLRL